MAQLHRPESLAEACQMLSEVDNAMVYGGGTAIQILARQGILFADNFVDLAGIPGLDRIVADPSGITVGPMVSLRRMETDPLARAAAPIIEQAYRQVANPRVRNTASVGGNIAHGDYRLDPPTALLVLDGTVHAESVRGTRSIPVREFFTDFQRTALEPDELITAIRVPGQRAGSAGAFVKYSSLSENDWPCASIAALGSVAGNRVRVGLGIGALAPVPRYVSFDATGMTGEQTVQAAIDAATDAMEPIPDIRGSAEYKLRLGAVAVEDAVRRVLKELGDA